VPVPLNLAQRLAGSSEIFHATGRAPQAGINFITAHDGFTLRDLVSYQNKHNELNGEAIATGTATTCPGTAARKARAAIRGPRKTPPPAARAADHAVDRAGRADAAGRR
jgi:pullulanase/glycogen debranching enzyme